MRREDAEDMAGLSYNCSNCGEKVVVRLREVNKPIICVHCKNDLTNDPKLLEQLRLLRQATELLIND